MMLCLSESVLIRELKDDPQEEAQDHVFDDNQGALTDL